MSNSQIIVIRGTVDWNKTLGNARPYTGNPKYDKGPYWSVDITPDAASRKKMKAAGIDGKLRDPKGEKDMRKESFITLRHLENRADGKKNSPPHVETSNGKAWDQNSDIGNGSVADVMIKVVDYGSGSDKGAYFQKMRIVKHVEFDGAKDFEPMSEDDEFFAAGSEEDTPWDSHEQAGQNGNAPEKTAKENLDDDLDDIIE